MNDRSTLKVDDMTCDHCVGTVRAALEEALPNPQVEIDLSNHRVTFTGDRAKGEDAIREAGYTPEAF